MRNRIPLDIGAGGQLDRRCHSGPHAAVDVVVADDTINIKRCDIAFYDVEISTFSGAFKQYRRERITLNRSPLSRLRPTRSSAPLGSPRMWETARLTAIGDWGKDRSLASAALSLKGGAALGTVGSLEVLYYADVCPAAETCTGNNVSTSQLVGTSMRAYFYWHSVITSGKLLNF